MPLKNMKSKGTFYFIALFLTGVCLIFHEILFLRTAFLKADYLQQLFPWSALYSDSIKTFNLPMWIRGVQCGFPLFAEGQTGVLYPFNLIFFLILPLKAAYNYSFLFHFAICGIFTFFFARRKGADVWGGGLAALLICFGSAYAGCFIHLASLRALAWFPLVLLLFDEYLKKNNPGSFLLISIVAGMQLLAGSMQMSAYAFFFYFLYFIHGTRQGKKPLLRSVGVFFIVTALSLTIALPQLLATYKMSGLSNRISLMTPDFALWNSLSPAALVGCVMPYVGELFARGNIIYISVLGLFFSCVAIWLSRSERPLRPLVVMLIFSILLALGKYNPVYTALIKAANFYSFRAPSRFIFFGIFSLAVLAGAGFTYLMENREKVPGRVYNGFLWILSGILGVFFTAKAVLRIYGSRILQLASTYVKDNIYGKPFHRYDLETYMERTEGFYRQLKSIFSFENPYVIMTLLVVLCSFLFIYALKRSYRGKLFFKYASLVFICAELVIFSRFSKGLKAEIASFEYIVPKERSVFNVLKNDNELYRICPFGRFETLPVWLKPSMNTYYGIDSIAIYSPLVNADYFDVMKGTGVVDDSIGIFPPEKEVLYQKLSIFKKLNVKYIVSTVELEHDELDFVLSDKGLRLYVLKNYLPRCWISSDVNGANDVKSEIRMTEYSSGRAEVSAGSKTGGYLIFSEKFYPGWEVYVNGKKEEMVKASGILQAVKIAPGKHDVTFKYDPEHVGILIMISTAAFFLVLLIAVLFLTSGKYKPGRLFAGGNFYADHE